jgi:hypothetical protein
MFPDEEGRLPPQTKAVEWSTLAPCTERRPGVIQRVWLAVWLRRYGRGYVVVSKLPLNTSDVRIAAPTGLEKDRCGSDAPDADASQQHTSVLIR